MFSFSHIVWFLLCTSEMPTGDKNKQTKIYNMHKTFFSHTFAGSQLKATDSSGFYHFASQSNKAVL